MVENTIKVAARDAAEPLPGDTLALGRSGRYSAKENESVASHYRGETILRARRWRMDSHLVSLLDPSSVDVEHYRKLRHSIETRVPDNDEGHVIAVTSPVGGDGKTLTSLNLAGTLAHNRDAAVVVVELDLRQPRNGVSDYLGIRKQIGPGVNELVLDHQLTIQDSVYYLPDYNLYVLPSGARAETPYEVMRSARLGRAIEALKQRFDYVIIDTAPIGLVPDSQLIAPGVDGFLVVVSAGKTPRDLLEEALNAMSPEKVLGLVFNGCSPVTHKYYGYYS